MNRLWESFIVQSKNFIKRCTKILLIFLAFIICYQQVNIASILNLINGEAQGFLLTADRSSIYEGDEIALTIARSTEEVETIEFTLPEGLILDVSPTEINFSDTTEFTYDNETNHVKISYAEGDSDKEVKLYVSCEKAGTYKIPISSTNGAPEELELTVDQVVEVGPITDEQVANEEITDEQVTNEEITDEEITDEEATDEEITDEEATDEELTNEESAGEEVNQSPRAEDGVGSVVDGVARVYNTKEYMDAIANKSVHTILVEQDFVMDESESVKVTGSNSSILHWNKVVGESYHNYGIAYTRDLVIDGQGHTVDFRDVGTYFSGTTSNPMNLTVKNFVAYGRNYWGPWRLQNKGTIHFENVEYYGAQLSCSYEGGNLIFSGEIYIEQQKEYESPFDNKLHPTQASGQANIESDDFTITAGTKYTGISYNAGAWYLRHGGKVNVEEGAEVNLYTTSTGGEATSTIYVEGSGGVLNIKEGAIVNIYNVASSGSIRPAIYLAGGANLNLSGGAQLNILVDGNMGVRAGIYLSSGAKFIVEDGAQLDINLKNQGSSTQDAIYGAGNNTFIIGKRSTFDVRVDGTGSRKIINIGGLGSSNVFQFADAERVNLQLDNTNSSSRLISMNGKLDVDIQKVSLWTERSWSTGEDDNPNYSWTPIYGLVATYSSANISSVTANSLSQEVASDFTNTFKSVNSSSSTTKRLLFEYIPDVEISLNDLSDDTTKTNSYTISGIANPGAYVLVSGHDNIPAGTIAGQADSDETLYHAVADFEGNFSITLEEGHYFTAGQEITAYAFLNGKTDTATTIVLDEVAPDKPTIDFITSGTTAFTGEAEANSIVTIHKDGTVIASGTADSDGKYKITIPSEITLKDGDQYYAIATDAAGNESEPSDTVTVIIAKPYVEMFVENSNGTDEYGVDDRVQYTIVLKNLTEDTRTIWSNIDLKDSLPSGLIVDTATFKKVYSNFYGEIIEYSIDASEVWEPSTNLLNIKHDAIYGTEEIKITFEAIIGEELASSTVVNTVILTSDYFEEITDEIEFKVAGGLEFLSAPNTMNFGKNLKISSKEKIYQLESKDKELIVQDSRGIGNTWSMTAKLLTEFTSESGHELLGSLYYIANGQEYAFTRNSSVPIYDTVTEGRDPVVISNSWGDSESNITGPVLKVFPGQARSEAYHGEVQWTLQDVPGND